MMCALVLASAAWPQGLDVSIDVTIGREKGDKRHLLDDNIVVWLTPMQKDPEVESRPHPLQKYTLAQKNKQFIPHVIVVPTGSSVDFPNLDPFFHNVFSLFNGKRFDHGLYEAHTHRAVQFDREGISYIFCNIHPEMGAVVISLNTPYYTLAPHGGTIILHDVPSGSYEFNVWAENVAPDKLNALRRIIQVAPQHTQLGAIQLQAGGDLMAHHKNKFGESYPEPSKEPY